MALQCSSWSQISKKKCSSWPDLPQEIVEIIFNCSKDPIDILRCGAACKSWLPIALKVYPKFLPQCFIIVGKVKDDSPVLLNFLTKEARKIQVPEAKEKWIYSYSNSWLFIIDSNSPYPMQLLNVFSRARIDLPPFTSPALKTPPDGPTIVGYLSPFNWKLLLSKCPLDSDCVVFLLREWYAVGAISSWKPGWSDWKTFYCSHVYDAILYKGKLYATISDSMHGNFRIIILNHQLVVEAKVSIPETLQIYSIGCHFLVKSLNEDSLLVGDFQGILRFGKPMEIFEFDVRTKEFRKVNDLGGYALFLGPNHFLAKARSSETWFKANRIYFFRQRGGDYVVYDLDEQRMLSNLPCQALSKGSKVPAVTIL